MNNQLTTFAARLRETISHRHSAIDPRQFSALALELFALQFQLNPVYRKICEARQRTPQTVGHWTEIPPVPTSVFKELDLSCIPPAEQTAVFHSSGTTDQKPSRHFHCPESLALYEASLWHWFSPHFSAENELLFLTPDQTSAPRSSLVHMFETVGQAGPRVNRGAFCGILAADGSWTVDFERVVPRLTSAASHHRPLTILGTAFSFVHLLDFLDQNSLRFDLPAGSQVMETGGYKNRSRTLPKAELHALITHRLGVGRENIICEYGMSELGSQAYDSELERRSPTRPEAEILKPARSETGAPANRCFHFPPWARAQIISPETGREVPDSETGIIRIFDLANAFSVAAIQTEDLGVRRGDGFELIGRADLAEPRGCSLMAA
jgi:hypothetical protein